MSADQPVLFLVVDAIPYDIAAEVWAAGGLPWFAEPRPMVSTFPSLTNVAVPALLRGAIDVIPPGYESRWFHPATGEVRGGLADPEGEPGMAPYRTRPSTVLDHVAVYALRQTLAWEQVRWISLRFRFEGGPWLGYLSATDGVGHFGGEDALRRAFVDICDQVVAAREAYAARHGVVPDVVMCSDHGMAFADCQHLDATTVTRRLERIGLERGASTPGRFALAPMGDVGAGAVWCDPVDATSVAQAVAELPGVDLAVARTDGGAQVVRVVDGITERAVIRWQGTRYGYHCVDGDPLGLATVFDAIAGTDGLADETALLHATWETDYPDALVRIRSGLTDLVQHPAAVLFSMAEGWTHGRRLAHAASLLVGSQSGTHGALSRAQSLGFVATTGQGSAFEPLTTGPAVRATDVFRGFAEGVRLGSALDN